MAVEEDFSALEELANKVPVELLRAGPKQYAPLDPEVKGSWRFVNEDGMPSAVIWTDWDKAFGVITVREGEAATRIYNYVTFAKAFDFSAGWAYSTVEEFVKRFEDSVGSLSDPHSGKLAGALKDASGIPRTQEEKAQEEEEDPNES